MYPPTVVKNTVLLSVPQLTKKNIFLFRNVWLRHHENLIRGLDMLECIVLIIPKQTHGDMSMNIDSYMEGIIGRFLANNEHVHHINGMRWDNRPENLQVLSASQYARLQKCSSSV